MEDSYSESSVTNEQGDRYCITENLNPAYIEELLENKRQERLLEQRKKNVEKRKKDIDIRKKSLKLLDNVISRKGVSNSRNVELEKEIHRRSINFIK